MIELKNISKSFKVARREAGMKNAVKGLFKRDYTYIDALKNVSFTINDGEMVGYIGPNGAGKSSTIKVMSGILTPDSGECIINGRTPWRDRQEHVKEIGVVFGQRSQLWWDVPVVDSFDLLKDIYKIDDKSYKKNVSDLTELLDLQEILRTPTRQLSLGQRMRCEIAASLIHSPRVLFLDEPTIGLDAVSKIAVRSFVRRINKENGTTVILTTHDMQDIEALTERVMLIGKGQILLDGKLSDLRNRGGAVRKMTVEYGGGNALKLPAGAKILKSVEGHAEIEVDTSIISSAEVIALVSSSVSLRDITIESESVDEMVLSLYKEFKI